MTTTDECLAHVLPKLNRAEKHLGDLDAAIKKFVATEPYGAAVESDPNTGECVLRISKIEPVPIDVSLIAGDAIQNLMSALDHLAYQLVCVSCGGKPPNPKWIYFPVGNDAPDYQTKRDGKIRGARQEIIDEIDLIEPYKGGKGDKIWTLYQLNNIEKHRLLFTVASTLSHWSFSPPSWGGAMLIEQESGAKFSIKSATVHVADPKPLQKGDELFRFPCKSKLNDYAQPNVGIALSEPDTIPIQWLVTLILELGKEVEEVILRLKPFLS